MDASRRVRRRRLGPTLHGAPFPLTSMTLSLLGHAFLLGALAFAGLWVQQPAHKVYVVNLVGGLPSPVREPARPTPARPAPPPPSPPREVRTPPPAKQEPPAPKPPPAPKELPAPPATKAPGELPPRALVPSLEERKLALPPRVAELPRRRELPPPTVPRPEERKAPPPPEVPPKSAPPPRTPTPQETRQPVERPSPTPPPTAQQQQASVGTRAVSADVSDFPFAWYLRQVLGKVEQGWSRRPPISEPRERPVIFVEILRDGSIAPPRIEKSSGNPIYDQAALRAVTEASPFPPLPQEWHRPTLRIQFGFELPPSRG